MTRKALFTSVLSLAGIGLLFVAFMGYAHTPAGHPLLRWMAPYLGMKAACPLGYDRKFTLEDRERWRKTEADKRLGKPDSSNRFALDFTLGKTSRLEAERWVVDQGGKCRTLHTSFESECEGHFFQSQSSTLWLEFDAHQNLISLRGIEDFQSPVAAVDFFNHLSRKVPKASGAFFQTSGHPQVSKLKTGLLNQASIQSDFHDYTIIARVTNMGNHFVVTNDFQAL